MKKSLVLAMAMALGVTASAYAANPFSDVPAGHWAYDSVAKLAASGIVQGYGDTTFGGDKLMTRYEMAEIVAKALAKGANVDKLAAEFADELNKLGVRVAKLEKKADNVKISGTILARSYGYHANARNAMGTNNRYVLRSDLFLKGQVNEDWAYTSRIRNVQEMGKGAKNVGEETTKFVEAYVTGKVGGLNVTAGRYNDFLEDGDIYDYFADVVKVSYGKKVKLTGAYGQLDGAFTADSKFSYARLDVPMGKINFHAGYYNMNKISAIKNDSDIYAVGLEIPMGKDLSLAGTYFRADEDDNNNNVGKMSKNSFAIGLNYKGAQADKVGSYGLNAKYYSLGSQVAIGHTMDAYDPTGVEVDGFKGWKVGANYTLAKNIRAEVDYYGFEGRESKKNYDTLYAHVMFNF